MVQNCGHFGAILVIKMAARRCHEFLGFIFIIFRYHITLVKSSWFLQKLNDSGKKATLAAPLQRMLRI